MVEFMAFLAVMAALAGIFCLYMSDLYPVSTFGHIVRYAMYAGLSIFALASGYAIDYAEQKLQKLKKLRRKEMRGR